MSTATALGEVRPILDFVPSPLNMRKTFDKDKLQELADSIKSKGIIEPLVVRQRAGLAQLEIVAGERRYRAAKLAGLTELPAIIRTLSDLDVLELMAIENSQRDDLHPLEEAEGYLALQKAEKSYTAGKIAGRIGKSERYVQNRLLYVARLTPDVKKAFLADDITAGHADLLVRLKPEDQKRALEACHAASVELNSDLGLLHEIGGDEPLYDESLNGTRRQLPVQRLTSVRELDSWIKNSIRLDPAGPETDLFPELRQALPTPEEGKAAGAPPTILQVCEGFYEPVKGEKGPHPLNDNDWMEVDKKKKCEHAQRAVIVLGSRRGQILEVCIAKGKCKTHWPHTIRQAPTRSSSSSSTSSSTSAAEKKRRQAELAAEKRRADAAAKELALAKHHAVVVTAAVAAAVKKVPATPHPALLKLIQDTDGGPDSTYATWRAYTVDHLERLKPHKNYAGNVVFHGGLKRFRTVAALLKSFGVNVAAIEKQLAAQTTAAKKTADEKTAKQTKKRAAARKSVSARMKKYWQSKSSAAKKGRK